ncbi:hypothetical protein AAF712_007991 [Marasmius tenuissimus]|uniref:Uncharacterized protein n=1 Tax=Marasmius tenuissimus TaxID=585030 RepID=A0ABR2ZUP3_9AGAR
MNNIAPTVLPSLVLPRLSTLSLHESRSWGKSNIPQYTDFLRRGSQTITHLVWQVPALETAPMNLLGALESEADNELLALLRVLPNLHYLHHLHISQLISLPNEILTPAFFRKLFAFQDGASPVLPRLKDLTIELGEEDLDIDGFVDAVRSRILPDNDDSGVRTYIQSLSIYGTASDNQDLRFDDDELDVLYSLKDVGLTVHLYCVSH